MDLRLVSLLLLLAYACGAWSRTTRNYPRIVPRRQPPKLTMQRRSTNLLQRPVRAISEFLEPPPLSANHVQFPPLLNYRLRKPNNNNHNPRSNLQAVGSPALSAAASLPPRGKLARNGRYARPQSADRGSLSNLINWLNPFGSVDAATKDPHAQDSSNFPQYAPHMPYAGGHAQQHGQYGEAGIGPSPLPPTAPTIDQLPNPSSTWTSGKSCNPCDVFPWTPVIRNDINSYPGQYAANFGSNNYDTAPPPAARPLDAPGYLPPASSAAFGAAPESQRDNYQNSDPHLSSGATPPLYQAQPFRDASQDYYSAPSSGQLPPPVFHQASPANSDQHGHHPHDHHLQQQQQQQQPLEHFQHQPSPVDFQPQVQYNHQAPGNNDQHYNIYVQQSPIIDVEQAPIIEEEHPPPGLDYHQTAATNVEPIQQHQSTQHVDVTKDAPFDLNVEISNQQDADHAESRPIFITSEAAADSKEQSRASGTSVHFQRSPLVELSVAGESTPTSSSRVPAKPKAKANAESSTIRPSATLIDYIVSSPRETSGREETRPTTSTTSTTTTTSRSTSSTTTTTTTATTTTDRIVVVADQKQQESHIETLVQAYEFYKNDYNRTKLNETLKTGGRVFSENDDFSASREALAPSNSSESTKKIIQIIIPYTSQYTPSPFHPTKSVSQRDHRHQEQTTRHAAQLQLDVGDDNSIEDSVLIQESKRTASVTLAPKPALRNNQTGNSIDVHRLQKNIDNWTIQEFSKKTSAIRNSINATYPRWISSKQIPDEYLLAATEEDSNEYYDFSHETQLHRGINRIQVTTSTTTTIEPTSRVKVVNAIYPKNTKRPEYPTKSTSASSDNSGEKERVYVVTPIPNPNSLEILSVTEKEAHEGGKSKARRAKVKQDSGGLEQAYQVLPQAVNNLAVLANAPESAAPALWGIMEHEQIAASPNQPRWRSESDVLPEPASTPVLYAGHSKVTYFRTKVH